MSKFKPGDLVWVRGGQGTRKHGLDKGEYAGIVISDEQKIPSLPFKGDPPISSPWYAVDIPNQPIGPDADCWGVHEKFLRPRRDDYQQHEPRVNRKDLDKTLQDCFKHPVAV